MSNLLEKFEAKAAEWVDDIRKDIADHQAEVDAKLDDVKNAALSQIGEALEAAAHVSPEMVVHLITTLEADLAKAAGNQPAPTPTPTPADGPVVAGTAL